MHRHFDNEIIDNNDWVYRLVVNGCFRNIKLSVMMMGVSFHPAVSILVLLPVVVAVVVVVVGTHRHPLLRVFIF
jgi:hypothetical protein